MFTRIVAGLALLAPIASANTYIVDASGGGAFTDIQTAILATQAGDVLLVQPGTYAPFALDRGLTIIGYGACNVPGGFTIAGIPAGETGVVVHVDGPTLSIQGCAGHVIVQEMQQPSAISVSSSPDVRMARITMPRLSGAPPAPAATVSTSRLEVVSSLFQGQHGTDYVVPANDGASGIACTNARLHFARSTLWGGTGATIFQQGVWAGFGGYGLELTTGSEAIFCGLPTDELDSGGEGLNLYYSSCLYDGESGKGCYLGPSSLLRISGVTLNAWPSYVRLHCIYLQGTPFVYQGGTVTQPSVADPSLVVSGTPLPGSPVQFTLDGPVGASVVLSFGRNAVVQVDPNTVIEVLTPPSRNVNLGTIPASGSVSFTWPIASVLLPGTRLFAQGRVTLASGEVRRTNSVPVILR